MKKIDTSASNTQHAGQKVSSFRCSFVKNRSIATILFASYLLPFVLLCPLSSQAKSLADSGTVQISADNIDNLGISLGKLTPVSQIPVLYAPAKVVIPPTQEYIVSASQSGLITRLNAAIGDTVKQGEVLAALNSSDLLSMQRLYLKADSELELGQLSYQRDKKLLDDGVIAERRWQETRSQYNAFVSEANEHRQLLEIAGMTADEIDRLRKTHHLSGTLSIRSPISGIVMERMAVAGARIDSLAPLYRIANLDELWLEINIPQERMAQIKIGDKVLLEKPVTETQELEQRKEPQAMPVSAQITLLGQYVNPENQTILARAVIKGAQTDVRPGQRINTQIIEPNSSAAFSVPNTAIAQHEGKSFIFVRTAEGFKTCPITVIGKQGDDSTINGDLTGNEDVAVKGAVALKANLLGLGGDE